MPWCIDFTVDEGGSAEPTRDKNIIGMYTAEGGPTPPLLCDPRLGRLPSRSGGCEPVEQATENIMGRTKKNGPDGVLYSSKLSRLFGGIMR